MMLSSDAIRFSFLNPEILGVRLVPLHLAALALCRHEGSALSAAPGPFGLMPPADLSHAADLPLQWNSARVIHAHEPKEPEIPSGITARTETCEDRSAHSQRHDVSEPLSFDFSLLSTLVLRSEAETKMCHVGRDALKLLLSERTELF